LVSDAIKRSVTVLPTADSTSIGGVVLGGGAGMGSGLRTLMPDAIFCASVMLACASIMEMIRRASIVNEVRAAFFFATVARVCVLGFWAASDFTSNSLQLLVNDCACIGVTL